MSFLYTCEYKYALANNYYATLKSQCSVPPSLHVSIPCSASIVLVAMVMESHLKKPPLNLVFILHAVAMFDLIADPDPPIINEGNFGLPITISLVSGSRPLTDVVITFTVSGTATGNVLKLHVHVNTVRIAMFSFFAISAGVDYEAPGDFTYTTFGKNDQTFNLAIFEDSIAEFTDHHFDSIWCSIR